MIAKTTLKTMLLSAVALTVVGAGVAKAEDTAAAAATTEKCYGVVKAAKNDCANDSKSHSCAGHAAADGVGDEFVNVPTGLCAELVNGSLTPVAAAPAAETPAEAPAEAH